MIAALRNVAINTGHTVCGDKPNWINAFQLNYMWLWILPVWVVEERNSCLQRIRRNMMIIWYFLLRIKQQSIPINWMKQIHCSIEYIGVFCCILFRTKRVKLRLSSHRACAVHPTLGLMVPVINSCLWNSFLIFQSDWTYSFSIDFSFRKALSQL